MPTTERALPSQPRALRAPQPLPTSNQLVAPVPEGAVPKVAEAIMELAAALEVQEIRIKAGLLEAAESGDLDLVRKILNLWVKGPVSEVTAQLGENRSVQIRNPGPVS